MDLSINITCLNKLCLSLYKIILILKVALTKQKQSLRAVAKDQEVAAAAVVIAAAIATATEVKQGKKTMVRMTIQV